MPRPGLLLYFDILPALDVLPAATVGELLLAALHYAQDGAEPDFEDNALTFAWAFLKPAIDRDGAAYDEKQQRGDWLTYCRKCKRDRVDALDFETWRQRTDNGTLRLVDATLPSTTTFTDTTTSPTKRGSAPRPRFVPPTLDEVRAYCLERRNQIDPTAFVDYYQARGWKLNGGQAMRDWRAAVRTWEKRERPSGWGKPTKPSAPADFQPSSERIQKSGEWLDQFLASQEQETHHQLQEDHKKEPPPNDRETAHPLPGDGS